MAASGDAGRGRPHPGGDRRSHPMDCCQCQSFTNIFDKRSARRQLATYLRRGPDKTTRILVGAIEDALGPSGLAGASVLDIGGGIRPLQFELFAPGARTPTTLDAPPPDLDPS